MVEMDTYQVMFACMNSMTKVETGSNEVVILMVNYIYYDFSGYSIDLSADGSVVAIGAFNAIRAYLNYGNGDGSGHFRVFKYDADDGDWVKRGDDIHGESAGDESGGSVAMSADGSAIAIGAE